MILARMRLVVWREGGIPVIYMEMKDQEMLECKQVFKGIARSA